MSEVIDFKEVKAFQQIAAVLGEEMATKMIEDAMTRESFANPLVYSKDINICGIVAWVDTAYESEWRHVAAETYPQSHK